MLYDYTALVSAILFFILQQGPIVRFVNRLFDIKIPCPTFQSRITLTLVFLVIVYVVNVHYYRIMDTDGIPTPIKQDFNILGAVEIKKAFANAMFSGFIFYICSEPDLYKLIAPKLITGTANYDCPDMKTSAIESVVYYFAIYGIKMFLDR